MDWDTEQSSKMEWEFVGHFNNVLFYKTFWLQQKNGTIEYVNVISQKNM